MAERVAIGRLPFWGSGETHSTPPPSRTSYWENQSGYYLSIRRSTLLGNSEPFIDFMLERILQAIKGKGEEFKNVGVGLSSRERDLLELLRLDGTLTAARIAETYSIFYAAGRATPDRTQEKGLSCS